MSDIKIPVSAELNQQEIDQQIAQVKAALTDLARVAEQAGKTRFTPISKIDLEDVRAMRAEFEAMVRLAPALKKALSLGGQDGRSFEQVDWGKVWEGQSQRSSQASTVLRYLRPDALATASPNRAPSDAGQPDSSSQSSPGSQSSWRSVAGSAAADLAGSVANQVGGLGGGIASGALAGAASGGGRGAALGAITGGLSAILDMMAEARDLAASYDTLKRTLGDVNISFDGLQSSSRSLADQYALGDSEVSSLLKRYANLAGGTLDPAGLGNETGVGIGFAQSFGLEPSAAVDFFGRMKGMGLTKDANDNKRLALMIGESVAKAGDLPRMGDVLSNLGRYVEGASRVSLSSPGSRDWLSRMAGLENTGLAGMNPNSAAGIINTIDNTIRQGGNSEAGKNFMSGVLQRDKNLNPIQAEIQLEGGAFGTGKSVFGPDSAMAAYYARFGGGTHLQNWSDNESTVSVLQKRLIEQYAGKSPDLLLNAFKTTFGTSYGQSAAWLTSRPEDNDRMVSRLQRLGIDPRDVSGSGISRLSQIESDASLSEAQKDAKTKEAASQNQEDTKASEAQAAAVAGNNALLRLAGEGLPALTAIQNAVQRMAGIDPVSAKIDADHKVRRASISKNEEAEFDAAQAEYDRLVPFDLIAASRRLLGAPLNAKQQAAKDRRDAAKTAYEKAWADESERYGREKWTGVSETPATSTVPLAAGQPSATSPATQADDAVPTRYENDPAPDESASPGAGGARGVTPELLQRAAESDHKAGLPPGTTAALMMVESSFISNKTSSKGAKGLFQIMPDNITSLSRRAGRQLNPFNTNDSFYMYDELMAERKRYYRGNIEKMLRSYHGGYDESQWGPANRDYLPAIDKSKRELTLNGGSPLAQVYQMPQTMQHAVAVDVTLRDPSGNRLNNVSIDTSVGRPVVSGSGAKTL